MAGSSSRPAAALEIDSGRLSRRQFLRRGALLIGLAGAAAGPVDLVRAAPAPVADLYRLPWTGGQRIRVSQTRGKSHTGSMMHAIDFALPAGEPVLAARGGRVSFREDKYTACGGPALATRGNHVVVDHGDGTSALYLHLQAVRVTAGQTVAQGDVLGTSGSTGWTNCSTHLHFQLQRTSDVWFARSLPVTFGDPDVRGQEPNGVLRYDRSYTSGNRGPTAATAAPSGPAPVLVAASFAAAPGPARLSLNAWVRERPTRDSPRLTLLPAGTRVEVRGVAAGEAVEAGESRWARISHQGREGYLYWGVLAFESGGSSDGTPGKSALRAAASLRERPTTTARRLTLLPAGTTVEIEETVEGQQLENGNRWARVRANGQSGFVYASLIGP
ncbi:MAG TPA: M23 family metallopeptidase [Dehalococcoidia bacterium]|nr:M23 family metallopeptidase [Dehalococcoidia bacterium]